MYAKEEKTNSKSKIRELKKEVQDLRHDLVKAMAKTKSYEKSMFQFDDTDML